MSGQSAHRCGAPPVSCSVGCPGICVMCDVWATTCGIPGHVCDVWALARFWLTYDLPAAPYPCCAPSPPPLLCSLPPYTCCAPSPPPLLCSLHLPLLCALPPYPCCASPSYPWLAVLPPPPTHVVLLPLLCSLPSPATLPLPLPLQILCEPEDCYCVLLQAAVPHAPQSQALQEGGPAAPRQQQQPGAALAALAEAAVAEHGAGSMPDQVAVAAAPEAGAERQQSAKWLTLFSGYVSHAQVTSRGRGGDDSCGWGVTTHVGQGAMTHVGRGGDDSCGPGG